MNNKKILLVLFALLALFLYIFGQKQMRSPALLAKQVMNECKDTSSRPNCYEKEIPKLMSSISMEDAFEVTRLVQDADPIFLYCHVLAHELSFRESKKSPEDWKSILNRCPAAMCNYGCLHGSLVEHFRGDVLTDAQIAEVIPELANLCEPREGFAPTEIDRTMCYHAIGHLAMYITAGKPDRAIPICQATSVKPDGRDYTYTCVEGVFMTVFQGVDPEDIALVRAIKPEKKDVATFCRTYGREAFWQSCRRESYPLFSGELRTAAGIEAFCAYATDEENRRNCISGAGNVFTDAVFATPEGLTETDKLCGTLVGADRESCFTTVASRLVQIEPLRHIREADEVCKHAETFGAGKNCWEGLVYYASFSFSRGTKEYLTYCNTLSSPWNTVCLGN
jgi:hypothetical protein